MPKSQSPSKNHLSTSTYKLSKEELEMQKEEVSRILEHQVEIYRGRGEKMIFEGMHFSDEFIERISSENCLKIFVNNSKSIKDRVALKQKTRLQFSIEKELEYSPHDSVDFEKTSYYSNQNRINEIHDSLKKTCLENGFIELNFENLEDAIKRCELLVEEYLLKSNSLSHTH